MTPVSGLEILEQRATDARTALDELLDHSSVHYHDVNAGVTSVVFIGWNEWQWSALPDAAQPTVKRAREATERLRDFARTAVRVAAANETPGGREFAKRSDPERRGAWPTPRGRRGRLVSQRRAIPTDPAAAGSATLGRAVAKSAELRRSRLAHLDPGAGAEEVELRDAGVHLHLPFARDAKRLVLKLVVGEALAGDADLDRADALLGLAQPQRQLLDAIELRPGPTVEEVEMEVVRPGRGRLDRHLEPHRPEVELRLGRPRVQRGGRRRPDQDRGGGQHEQGEGDLRRIARCSAACRRDGWSGGAALSTRSARRLRTGQRNDRRQQQDFGGDRP